MQRRAFIKDASIACGAMCTSPLLGSTTTNSDYEFPLIDMHVHMTDKFTIEKIMEIAESRKVKFGIVEHPTEWAAIKNDADLKNYIEKLKKYPVHIGLQPVAIGWSKKYSPALLNQVDYILMDPQTIPMEDGSYQHIWEFDTYVENTEVFMERYMAHSLNILKNEPIDIFAWPLFLPVCIARDYYTIWTNDRMQQIISAAKARNIAIEINDMAHTPHEKFILMAKEQGLKFTFGSDARNNNAGRLDFCKAIAKKCKLKESDFFIPGKKAKKNRFN